MEAFIHFLLLLVILFTSFILCYFSFLCKPKPKSTFQNIDASESLQVPPGSTGWPFVGETLEFLSLGKKGSLEKFISDRVNKYSSKLFKTSYLGETMVFICSAEGIKFLFSNENKLVQSWLPGNFDKIFPNSDKTTMVDETMRIRKITTAFTEPAALQNYVRFVDVVAKEHLLEYWDCKQRVKVQPLAEKFTFTLACRLILSIHDSETVEELERLFNSLLSGLISLPINLPGTRYNRALKASKELRKKFESMIRQRRIDVQEKKKSDESKEDIFSFLIQEKYKDGESVSDSDLANKITGLILAAHSTTSATMVSIIKFLAELPKVYEGVLQEHMEIVKRKGPEELLNFEDIRKMKYSWNVASEVLRLQPPNFGTFREALTNFDYNGVIIPKGWKLHWAVLGTHKNPEYFPDPEKFDPSRFEENQERVPFSYVPFGGGPHICPGKEYARLQILVFMHNVITKFRWEKVFQDEQMIRDPLLVAAKGLPIHLYPHN
ncbi:putative Cytochrome P450 [Melia azedarach]|uniref:Cytochrome P450 n=1 Tax=Melia azedarach TaxID=155640 RepID=A0ACC1YL94_MELAZ|nr:putative Cytochrome P450 [Melia azedarach]